jgi:hypothetical protein
VDRIIVIPRANAVPSVVQEAMSQYQLPPSEASILEIAKREIDAEPGDSFDFRDITRIGTRVAKRFSTISFGPDAQRPTVAKRGHTEFARTAPIFVVTKDANQPHEVIGVVLEPTADPRIGPDSQGDVYTAEQVAQACDNFAGGLGVQHQQAIHSGARITRSWIQLADDFTSFPTPVYAGTWLMRWEITDPALWDQIVAGNLTGFSIGGTANRQPLAA